MCWVDVLITTLDPEPGRNIPCIPDRWLEDSLVLSSAWNNSASLNASLLCSTASNKVLLLFWGQHSYASSASHSPKLLRLPCFVSGEQEKQEVTGPQLQTPTWE